MAAADLPLEELRQKLAQCSLQGSSAAGPEAVYRDLMGFIPPCVVVPDTATLESKLRGLHEHIPLRELLPSAIDAKAAHLILLAMLLKEHGATAVSQGVAARRAGASWDELHGVVRLVFLLCGLPGANRGDEFLTALAEREREDRVADAMAAYG